MSWPSERKCEAGRGGPASVVGSRWGRGLVANVPPLPTRAGPPSGWHAPDVTSGVCARAARGEVPAPPAQVGQSFVPGAAHRNPGPTASRVSRLLCALSFLFLPRLGVRTLNQTPRRTRSRGDVIGMLHSDERGHRVGNVEAALPLKGLQARAREARGECPVCQMSVSV